MGVGVNKIGKIGPDSPVKDTDMGNSPSDILNCFFAPRCRTGVDFWSSSNLEYIRSAQRKEFLDAAFEGKEEIREDYSLAFFVNERPVVGEMKREPGFEVREASSVALAVTGSEDLDGQCP